jgi:hypothetical protein
LRTTIAANSAILLIRSNRTARATIAMTPVPSDGRAVMNTPTLKLKATSRGV